MKIVVIAHNIRSCHNIGSIMRTCEGLGIEHLYITGYSPYPEINNDTRLPHESAKLSKQIQKTALGAEETLSWSYHTDVIALIEKLKRDDYEACALEQTSSSKPLTDYSTSRNIALLLGEEVEGIQDELLELSDSTLEIPMFGKKESFNVSIAAAMALYHLRFVA